MRQKTSARVMDEWLILFTDINPWYDAITCYRLVDQGNPSLHWEEARSIWMFNLPPWSNRPWYYNWSLSFTAGSLFFWSLIYTLMIKSALVFGMKIIEEKFGGRH